MPLLHLRKPLAQDWTVPDILVLRFRFSQGSSLRVGDLVNLEDAEPSCILLIFFSDRLLLPYATYDIHGHRSGFHQVAYEPAEHSLDDLKTHEMSCSRDDSTHLGKRYVASWGTLGAQDQDPDCF